MELDEETYALLGFGPSAWERALQSGKNTHGFEVVRRTFGVKLIPAEELIARAEARTKKHNRRKRVRSEAYMKRKRARNAKRMAVKRAALKGQKS